MNRVISSVVILCASLFTASLIKHLAPHGRTEKILRIAISTFVIICLLTCIKSVLIDFNGDNLNFSSNTEQIKTEIDENILKVTGDYMVDYTENLLYSQGVTPKNVKVTVDTDENGVINITEVSIYLDKDVESAKQNAIEIIKNDLSIIPKIIVGE